MAEAGVDFADRGSGGEDPVESDGGAGEVGHPILEDFRAAKDEEVVFVRGDDEGADVFENALQIDPDKIFGETEIGHGLLRRVLTRRIRDVTVNDVGGCGANESFLLW